MFHRLFPSWDGFQHSAITGEPGFNKIFGQPVFDYIGTHPDLGPIFDAGMTAIHGHETGAMLHAYDFSPIHVLADIGGGNGSLIGAVLQRYPELKGLLFDLDHVVGRARESLKAYGVAERCSVVEGNFFESMPRGADTYLLRHIIHDWNDEQSVQILNNCRKVIPNNGRLLIIEAVVPTENEPSFAKDCDMVMLVVPGGIERTAEEYSQLLEQADFRLSSITPTASVISVVEGKPIKRGCVMPRSWVNQLRSIAFRSSVSSRAKTDAVFPSHCGRDLVVVGKISPCSRLGVNPAARGSSEEPSWILGQ